ncbi:MAG: glutathione peroxidase [Planctomycetota bacterium]|jgi:glutathione peroxidase|nr:glutathione peroxidase [Planctomycetota bacterium]MDA1025897.1 glutathione peroxidase [Planctomycetota bacterium]
MSDRTHTPNRITNLRSRVAGAIAGVAMAAAGIACTQSMPVTDELRAKWNDKTMFDLKAKTLDGKEVTFADWKGKAILVVNVASRCGYTPQYNGLQAIYEAYKDKGLIVIGFPCNDFGGQEPGTAADIKSFCSSKYGVDFPLMSKVSVKPGSEQSPIYEFLGTKTGKLPGWNFCKYLVSPDGTTIEFFDSRVDPGSAVFKSAIEKATKQVKPAPVQKTSPAADA